MDVQGYESKRQPGDDECPDMVKVGTIEVIHKGSE